MSLDHRLPVICLVTDRRRLAGSADDVEGLLTFIESAVEAGVDLVQIREPDLSSCVLYDLARRAVRSAAGTATRILLNDRVDVALAAGAAGVHLKSLSIPAKRVRALVPSSWIVGCSVHNVSEASQAVAAGAIDYLIAGTVFETTSKPGQSPIGLGALKQIAHAVEVPTLAIGGVTVRRAGLVGRAGAAGLAAIGEFVAGHELGRLVRGFRLEFDNGRSPLV